MQSVLRDDVFSILKMFFEQQICSKEAMRAMTQDSIDDYSSDDLSKRCSTKL